MIHDRVRQEMRAVLTEKTPCPFIDRTAQALLDEARQTFAALGLAEQHIIKKGSSCQIVSWLGDHANDALCLLLNHAGVSCGSEGLLISTNADNDKLMHALGRVAALDASDLKTLLADVKNMRREKWDWALPESLLMKSFASISLDIETAIGFAIAQAQQSGGFIA
jgi:ATP-dependent Lhr-like helicase